LRHSRQIAPPPGICKIDKTEPIHQLNCSILQAHPLGNGDIDAAIPGKCAAPPAPAITTAMPLHVGSILTEISFQCSMSRDDIYSVLHLNSFLGFLIASCMTGTS
jgi:hypothetical protein